jgi:hypothetical protein
MAHRRMPSTPCTRDTRGAPAAHYRLTTWQRHKSLRAARFAPLPVTAGSLAAKCSTSRGQTQSRFEAALRWHSPASWLSHGPRTLTARQRVRRCRLSRPPMPPVTRIMCRDFSAANRRRGRHVRPRLAAAADREAPSQVVMPAKRADLRRLSGSDGTRTRDRHRFEIRS